MATKEKIARALTADKARLAKMLEREAKSMHPLQFFGTECAFCASRLPRMASIVRGRPVHHFDHLPMSAPRSSLSYSLLVDPAFRIRLLVLSLCRRNCRRLHGTQIGS